MEELPTYINTGKVTALAARLRLKGLSLYDEDSADAFSKLFQEEATSDDETDLGYHQGQLVLLADVFDAIFCPRQQHIAYVWGYLKLIK
jgi:hypothetical protein